MATGHKVSNKIAEVTATPTITAGAYSALDMVGGLMTFTGAGGLVLPGGGEIVVASVIDKAKIAASLRLLLWNATPTTIADNAAEAFTDADFVSKFVGSLGFTTYLTFANTSVAQLAGGGFQFTGQTLYGQLQCLGTPTYLSTSDLTVRLMIHIL